MSNDISKKDLWKNQFKVLFIKRMLYTYRRWILTSFSGIATIGSSMLMMLMIYTYSSSDVKTKFNLSINRINGAVVYCRAGDDSVQNLGPKFSAIFKSSEINVEKIPSKNNLINDLFKKCSEDDNNYVINYAIAGDFNQNNSTIIYNNIIAHIPALAINIYTNALLHKLSGNDESYISTTNQRFQLDSEDLESDDSIYNTEEIIDIWIVRFTTCLLYLVGQFIAFPLNERVGGIKQQQFMTKLSPFMYWTVCFLWDYFCYTVVIVISLMTMYLFDKYNVFIDSNSIWVLSTLLLIYGWSSIFYVYVISFFGDGLTETMMPYITVKSIAGLILKKKIFYLNAYIYGLNKITAFNKWNILRYIFLMIPHISYLSCITGFIQITWENNLCKLPNMLDDCGDYANFEPKSYFVFRSDENKYAILEETLFLFFSSILYIVLLVVFEYKIFARLYQYGFNKVVGTGVGYKNINEDPDVGLERDNVVAAKSRFDGSPLLIVDDLIKKFRFKLTAVRGISFSVSPGECFGLLGVNGAGKTTTLRMLTGDLLPSKGDAIIQTDDVYKLSSNSRYVSMIGYCPQYDAVNDQLTGNETLNLMAILRGISPSNSEKLVNKWIQFSGLEECKDRICETYSGGDKRKLNTAMALIGDPPVVFLDEPTSGVDPTSRRNLWQLLSASQKRGQAIILASHSMDECEILCNRLTIMVDGAMKCIGNTQYLKHRYAQGFTVTVKLRNSEHLNSDLLKANIERQFIPDINLKDEHEGLLHYHITNPQIALSEIFSKMKKIKEDYPEIEEYTVGDTTLEQIFLAFARKQEVRRVST